MRLGDSKGKHALTTGISNKALASAFSTLFLHLWSSCGHFWASELLFLQAPGVCSRCRTDNHAGFLIESCCNRSLLYLFWS